MSEKYELLEQRIVNYIADRVGAPSAVVVDSEGLFSQGLLDSMAVMDLVAFVEKESGVKFSPKDINLENLDSVGSLLQFVERHGAQG